MLTVHVVDLQPLFLLCSDERNLTSLWHRTKSLVLHIKKESYTSAQWGCFIFRWRCTRSGPRCVCVCVCVHILTGVRSWRNKAVLRKGISGSECLTLTCNSQPDWLFCPSAQWVTVTDQSFQRNADGRWRASCGGSLFVNSLLRPTTVRNQISSHVRRWCGDIISTTTHVSQMMNPNDFGGPLTFVVLSGSCPDYCLKVNLTDCLHWNVFTGPVE